MNLHEVLHAGRSGFLYTAASITVAMLLGLGIRLSPARRKEIRILDQRWYGHLRRQRHCGRRPDCRR